MVKQEGVKVQLLIYLDLFANLDYKIAKG